MKSIHLKLLFISSLFPVFLHSADDNILEKRKVPKQDIASDRTSGESEFQINLITDKAKIPNNEIYHLLIGIPAIGIYDPADYSFRLRLALIKLSPEMIMHIMPHELQQALISALAPGKSIAQALQGKNVYAHIMITEQTGNKKTRPFNMVFHPFGYTYKKQDSFNEKIPMGVFGANGINPVSNGITFNEFKAQSVYPHNGDATTFALSPNNAQFAIKSNRSISTFWSAAYSPDKQYVTITFHILANDDETSSSLLQGLNQAYNFGDMLIGINSTKFLLEKTEDKEALENAMHTIRSIANWQETKQLIDLQQQLNQLSRSLQQLNQQLEQL